MTRQEAAQEAKRLKAVFGRSAAIYWIKDYKHYFDGAQWTPKQIAAMGGRKWPLVAASRRISLITSEPHVRWQEEQNRLFTNLARAAAKGPEMTPEEPEPKIMTILTRDELNAMFSSRLAEQRKMKIEEINEIARLARSEAFEEAAKVAESCRDGHGSPYWLLDLLSKIASAIRQLAKGNEPAKDGQHTGDPNDLYEVDIPQKQPTMGEIADKIAEMVLERTEAKLKTKGE